MPAGAVVTLVAAWGFAGAHEILTVATLAEFRPIAPHQRPVEVGALLLHPLLGMGGVERAGGILTIGAGHREEGQEKKDEQ
jgi:hypothetical protein